MTDTVKPLNSGHLLVLKNLSVIKRCPLLGGSLTKIFTFGTKHFVCYARHVHYLRCPLLGGFTVLRKKFSYFSQRFYEFLNNLLSYRTKHSSLSRPQSFKFFKGCLPQILLGSFLNILSRIVVQIISSILIFNIILNQ